MTTPSNDLAPARQEMVERARRALGTAGSASGVVVLTGPAGSGKTWLAKRIREQEPGGLGCAVPVPYVSGAPSPDPAAPPLWPWRRVLHAVTRMHPTNGVPAARSALAVLADPAVVPTPRIAEQVVDALQDAAAEAPFAIFLDDVHRFDPDSLTVLHLLCDPPSEIGPSVLACCAVGLGVPERISRALRDLADRDRVVILDVAPLTDAAVSALVADLAPDLSAQRRERVVRLSRGNPALATAFALAERAPGQQDLSTTPWPSASRALEERICTGDAVRVLAALAVMGRPTTVSLLADAAGTSVEEARQVIHDAVAEGLAESSGTGLGRVDFTHELIASTVRASLSPTRIRTLHYRIADLLGHQPLDGPGTVERARHLLGAGDRSAATARACLDAGAIQEGLGDLDLADEFACYGLEIQSAEPATRIELLRVRARVADRRGSQQTACRLAESAVALASSTPGTPGLPAAVADLLTIDRHLIDVSPERRRVIEQALDAPAMPDATRAVLLAGLSDALFISDLDAARRHAAEAVALAESSRDEAAVQAARASWLMVEHRLANLAVVEAEAHRMHQLGIRSTGLSMEVGPPLSRGDRGVIDAVLDHATQRSEVEAGTLRRGWVDLVRLGLAVTDGDVEAVKRHAASLAGYATQDFQAVALPTLLIWAGHSGQLLEEIGSFAIAAPTATDLGRVMGLTVETIAVLNDPTRSTDGVAALIEPRRILLEPREDVIQDAIMVLTAIVGSVLRDAELCRAALDHFAGHEDRFVTIGSLVVVAPVSWATAFAHRGTGDVEAALDANARALAASRRARFHTWVAQSLCQRAELLAPLDGVASAAAAREALALSADRGLDLIAHRLERLLAATSTPAPSPLSPAQEHVLALTATGLTNDQIAQRLGVAVSTVEKHLTQVYRRLGVPNRAAGVHWYSVYRQSSSGRAGDTRTDRPEVVPARIAGPALIWDDPRGVSVTAAD